MHLCQLLVYSRSLLPLLLPACCGCCCRCVNRNCLVVAEAVSPSPCCPAAAAARETPATRHLSEQRGVHVRNLAWLLECKREGRYVVPRPRHYLHISQVALEEAAGMKEEFAMEGTVGAGKEEEGVDEYGDPWFLGG